MSSAPKQTSISVDEYLEGELISPIKHEYIDGVVYAMAGARNQHNVIAGNIFARLHYRMVDKPCQPYNSDTKIRIRLPHQVRFYYPDASVVCRPNPPEDSYQDSPVAIVEVLSKKTRRIDRGEKKDAYLTIPSLRMYLLVESDRPEVVAYRRTRKGFVREMYQGLDSIVRLPEVEAELPMAEIYKGAIFGHEPEDEEDAD